MMWATMLHADATAFGTLVGFGEELGEFGTACGGRVTEWQDGDCLGTGVDEG